MGLNEWDGEQWHIYYTPQKSRIRSLSIWTDDKIYIGTLNDVGYYYPNTTGTLTYQSLLTDWSFEERQFGEVWSVASNDNGVMFQTNKYLLFWDGNKLQKITDATNGNHRIFSANNDFYYKSNNEEHLYRIQTKPAIKLSKTRFKFDKNTFIRNIFINNNQNMVIVTSKSGIYEVKNKKLIQQLTASQLPKDINLYNTIQASDGYYYVVSLFHGLFIISQDFELVKNYAESDGFGTTNLLSVIEDFQGNIWLSGVPNIIKMAPVHRYSQYANDNNSNDSDFITLIKDKVTVIGDSIYQLELGKTHLQPAYLKQVSHNRSGNWGAIAFQNHLVYAGEGGVYAKQYQQNHELSEMKHIVKTQFAKSFAMDDRSNTLFATSDEGLYRLTFNDNQWQSFLIPNLTDEIQEIEINNGIIWTGTSSQELYRIENAQYDDKQTKITKFIDVDGLGPNNVIPFKLSSGIVIGTNDGLMDYQENRQPQLQFLTHFPDVFHTKGLDVFRLYEDKQKNIWYRIGNRTGFIKQNENQRWEAHEDLFKYFPDSGYKGFVKPAENILWFSMANGEVFRANTDYLKDLPKIGKLNIRKITNLDTNEELYGGLGQVQLPTLSQQNNSIRIQFSLADYSIANAKNANRVKYRQKLIGSSNEEFSKWSNESHKDYTLLRGNDYQFLVEAKDAWGRVTSQSFNYSVLPPWYLSKTAWLIYFTTAILLLIISSWFTQKWRTAKLNQRNVELEKEVEERTADVQAKADELKQQQELKDRFFTNVSHEFRTPLTLTIAPLETFLSDNPKLDKSLLHPIKTALRNSKKMLSLVGQVLDINRLESGRFPLRVAQYNVSDLINTITHRFKPWAKQHKQQIMCANTQEPTMLYYDQDQLDKCLSNLISNAIKYSGDNSSINIFIVKKNNQTGIQVSDNGIGISAEFEDKIFQRFTQDKPSEQVTEPGTGIGLALVKELMELHHGEVELKNKPNEGCCFILWLMNGSSHFESSDLIEPITQKSKSTEFDFEHMIPIDKNIVANSNQNIQDITTLLVVDDNQELREFIASRLSSYYHILQASNGQEGFDIAQTQLPDLIISDVMMPIMNGYELTEKLKSNALTKTIPVILLTAKSSKREIVSGLKTGADDYLTKPFDTSELVMRVNGLIANRKLVRESIKSELTQQISHLDKTSSFIDKLRHEILNQLSEPTLSVESLSQSLSMSRHSLNRKCKSELDKTTGQVITETRMQHALSLLKLKKHSISEIAYGTGYDSLAYFSRTFKKHYGKTPSEIRNT